MDRLNRNISSLFLAIVFVVGASSSISAAHPAAKFIADPTSGPQPLTVQSTDTSSPTPSITLTRSPSPTPTPTPAPAGHYSLHDQPQTIYYKDASGASQAEVRRGFRPRHDLTDPKVLCGVEGGSCPEKTKVRFQNNIGTPGGYIEQFKIYVPAGSTYVYLWLGVDNLAKLAAKARLHVPPSGIVTTEYSALSATTIEPPSWTLFQSGEVVAKNAEGFVEILRQYFSTPLASGAWLYVTLTSFDGSEPTFYGHTFEVSVKEYLSWYRSVSEAGWAEFDSSSVTPGGSSTPTPTSTPKPTPTPTPVTTPTPSPKPPAPPVLSVLQDDEVAQLSWTPMAGATGYLLAYAPYPVLTEIYTVDLGPSTSTVVKRWYGPRGCYVAVLAYNHEDFIGVSNIEVLFELEGAP